MRRSNFEDRHHYKAYIFATAIKMLPDFNAFHSGGVQADGNETESLTVLALTRWSGLTTSICTVS